MADSDTGDKNGREYSIVTVQPGAGEGLTELIAYPGNGSCECDPPSRNITIQVDYGDPPDDGTFTNIIEALKIRYQWGVIGHVATADLVRGVPVTLAGPRVIVWAVYPRTVYAGQFALEARQPPLIVRTSIGLDGTRAPTGGTVAARFTQNIGTIGAGLSSLVFAVPAWATSAILQSNQSTVAALEFNQWTDANLGINLSAANMGKGDRDSIPIANGARFFTVVNLGLVAVTGVRVIFNLGI